MLSWIHSGATILSAVDVDTSFKSSVQSELVKAGVDLRLNSRVTLPDDFDPDVPQTLTLSNGEEVDADVTFLCWGAKPETSFLADVPDVLTEREMAGTDLPFPFVIFDAEAAR